MESPAIREAVPQPFAPPSGDAPSLEISGLSESLAKDALDRELALSRAGDDPDILRDVADLVLEHIPQWMAGMRDSLAMGDGRTLRRLAHTLKSSADNVGASNAYGAAARLEKLAAEENLREAQLALADLESEMHRLLPAVARLLAELHATVK
jgi:HPt (histidine-containing phosphotransfer) domain-containing protein